MAMRDASTYRGNRKKAARAAGTSLSDAPFRKIDIRKPTASKKGFALPLKAVAGGMRMALSPREPGKFVPDPEPIG